MSNTTQPSPSSGPQLQTRRTTFIRRIIPTLLALTCALTLVTAGFFPGNAVTPAQALANNLALTPPMGFNDWNAFGCGVTEQEIKQATDFIASHLKSAGYQYVNVDDCWMS
ncbi:MAG: hypothetical protein ACJ8LM_17525, partial [Candidatus Udaeobacter sp.]